MDKNLHIFLVALLPHLVSSDGFSYFVDLKVSNYTSWLKENNLDPSPLITGPKYIHMNNTLFDLDVELRNYGVKDHSIDTRVVTSFADLLGGFIWGGIYFFNTTFYGDYKANGTFLDGSPIAGEGVWRTHYSIFYSHYFTINFEATRESYLNITSFSTCLDFSELRFGTEEVYFENLLQNEAFAGYEYYVTKAMGDHYRQDLELDAEHPISSLFQKYWTDIFAETTLAEMVATTPSPPATTRIVSSPMRLRPIGIKDSVCEGLYRYN